jgi:hypothetical protein
MFKVPKDKRDKIWSAFESQIQFVAKNKDKTLILKGRWKRFLRNQQGYKIFAVDGNWIRNNLCSYFGHGGHGLVHEFIPLDEIWVSTHHYQNSNKKLNKKEGLIFSCSCRTNHQNKKVSPNYFESTLIHELTECELMKKGRSYWESHCLAMEKERQLGLLKDPFDDR